MPPSSSDSTPLFDFTLTTGNWTTTEAPQYKIPVAYGYVAVCISVLFFGSNFLPVKKFQTGNGVFFQWVLCAGIWIVGLIVHGIRGCPEFQPLAMIGGFLWCTGNMMVVPIINSVGLAKGILLWGSFNLLIGWASSRFGWFGIIPQNPSNPTMNIIGVVLCLVSACLYLFMKTSGRVDEVTEQKVEKPDEPSPSLVSNLDEDGGTPKTIFKRKELLLKIAGSVMAVAAGCLFGLNFIPVIYKKDRDPAASDVGLDYVFSHYTGIFTTSTAYFLIYCAVKKNNPDLYPHVALPGFVSGLMWGIANVAWFIANDALSEAISFPIVTTLPGIVGTLWGLLFREIRGWKNYLVLAVAICIGIAGAITTGFSK